MATISRLAVLCALFFCTVAADRCGQKIQTAEAEPAKAGSPTIVLSQSAQGPAQPPMPVKKDAGPERAGKTAIVHGIVLVGQTPRGGAHLVLRRISPPGPATRTAESAPDGTYEFAPVPLTAPPERWILRAVAAAPTTTPSSGGVMAIESAPLSVDTPEVDCTVAFVDCEAPTLISPDPGAAIDPAPGSPPKYAFAWSITPCAACPNPEFRLIFCPQSVPTTSPLHPVTTDVTNTCGATGTTLGMSMTTGVDIAVGSPTPTTVHWWVEMICPGAVCGTAVPTGIFSGGRAVTLNQ